MFSFGAYRFAVVQAYVGLLVLWCSVFPMMGLRVLLRLDSIRAQAADALEYVFTAALRQHIVRTLCKVYKVLQTLRSQKSIGIMVSQMNMCMLSVF